MLQSEGPFLTPPILSDPKWRIYSCATRNTRFTVNLTPSPAPPSTAGAAAFSFCGFT